MNDFSFPLPIPFDLDALRARQQSGLVFMADSQSAPDRYSLDYEARKMLIPSGILGRITVMIDQSVSKADVVGILLRFVEMLHEDISDEQYSAAMRHNRGEWYE